jgi:hypothetical protein
MMYVLTDGWYADIAIVGIATSEEQASEWGRSGIERDYYGPFEPGERPSGASY